MKYILFIGLSAGLLLSSCKDNDDNPSTNDTTKPTINTFLVNGAEEAVVKAGETLKYTYDFSDDVDLSEAYVEVHENFDGHSHFKANLAWSTSSILTILGKSTAGEGTLNCPANAASGPYHVEVHLLDASGNQSDIVVRNIVVTQDGQPVIDETTVPTSFAAGSDLSIDIKISDDSDIKELEAVLVKIVGNDEVEVGDVDVDLEGSTETTYQLKHTFSTNDSKAGDEYELMLKVVDSDDNHTVHHFDIAAE